MADMSRDVLSPLLAQTGPPGMSAVRPLSGAKQTLSKPHSANSIAAQIGGTHGESNEEEKVTGRGMDEGYALEVAETFKSKNTSRKNCEADEADSRCTAPDGN